MNAIDIAQGVRTGTIKAREAVEASISAISARESEINAFNLVTAEQAARRADEIDAAVARGEDPGPLAGVPIAIKDNIATKNIETNCSSRILKGWKPPYDATVVTRLAAAGAITIGKANLDEFAMGGSTETSAWGPSHNPRDTSRVPGGSSGGSAAAVAAGFAPIALGSDTGGSVRQPASHCGIVGLKPTYGRVSRYGLVAFASSLDQIGPMSNTVADSAALLQVIAGHDPMDSTSSTQPVPDYSAALGRGVQGMRIGIVEEMTGEGVDPGVQARIDAAIEALTAAGAKAEKISVPSVKYAMSAYYLIAPAEASSNLARYDGIRYGLRVEGDDVFDTYVKTRTEGFGAEVKRRIMLGTYSLSSGYYDAYYGKAQKVRALIKAEFERAYETFDMLVSPTAPTVAFPIGEQADDPLTMYFNDVFSIPTNLAGHASMSVPFGNGEHDMPVGVQLYANAWHEETLFAAGAVLEEASK